jgi:hypothetical protein
LTALARPVLRGRALALDVVRLSTVQEFYNFTLNNKVKFTLSSFSFLRRLTYHIGKNQQTLAKIALTNKYWGKKVIPTFFIIALLSL